MGKRAGDDVVERVRRFNRFYTRQLGVLNRGLLDSEYSLAEARVLYEIAHRPGILAMELGAELGLDRGYLSRILNGLAKRRLLARERAKGDARRVHLRLTAAGRKAFGQLDRRSTEQVEALTGHLSAGDRALVAERLDRVRSLLAPGAAGAESVRLRGPQPGDLGWIVQRHGAVYAAEYGWDARFEGLVAKIVADFAAASPAARQRAWIAERGGEPVGCVLVVEAEPKVAQLRLLLVEPAARGAGLGHRLVAESIAFARGAGFARMILWTNSVLHAARRIYEGAGFRLVKEEPHESFGQKLTGQYWELTL